MSFTKKFTASTTEAGFIHLGKSLHVHNFVQMHILCIQIIKQSDIY